MNILFYIHFYKPESGAAAVRAEYFVKSLRKSGHDVLIITPKPNYPDGKIYKGFKARRVIKDKLENIIYLPIVFTNSHSPFGRLISYLSYSIYSFFYLLFHNFKPDVVFSSSPPIFTAFAASIYCRLKKKKFVLDLRDIWPDIGIELGILKNRLLIFGLRIIEKSILIYAEKIIVTANGDLRNISSKIRDSNKCLTIFNGADTELFVPISESEKNDIRKKYNIPSDKVVLVYFGSYNHGMNDIDTLSRFLIHDYIKSNTFHFLSIGGGDNLNNLINLTNNQISSTILHSLPLHEVAKLVASSDISIIPRKDILNDTGGNIPVKCFESWAAGIPVLLSNIEDAEISRIFNLCGAGIIVPPNDESALISGLRELMRGNLQEIGIKGREFVVENYDRKKQSEILTGYLERS